VGWGMGTWDWEIPFTPPLEKGENKRGICSGTCLPLGEEQRIGRQASGQATANRRGIPTHKGE